MAYSTPMTFDNRLAIQRGAPHLSFTLGGKRIAYAYIRKNGCSAFKRAMGAFQFDELFAAHPWKPWTRHDATIFVWRDPVDRLVSLYRNKILDGTDNGDLIAAYRRTMGEEPSTFERFVEFAVQGVDPHCLRQRKHLKPIRYTHAIELSCLYETMVSIVGPEAAEPFRRPVNASSQAAVNVSDRALRMIEKHYAGDYAMIRRIRGEALCPTCLRPSCHLHMAA